MADVGRTSDYRPEFNDQVEKLCKLGLIDKEIAEYSEVTEQTINNWKKEYPEFFESIKRGKTLADANVSESLYKRANGYEHEEDDIRVVNNDIVVTPTIKHYPPDSTAMIFWLKNRRPKQWRDKQEIDHTIKKLGKDLADEEYEG